MHFNEEQLFEYAEGTSPIATEIESHVASCDRCSAEVGEHRGIVAHLADPGVWETSPSPPRQFVVDISAFAERARLEEGQAAALCADVLTGPAQWWPQRLRNAEGAQTAGMVKQLLEHWRGVLENAPANALVITALAIDVANALGVADYPCDYVIKLRAQAFRDHAYTLAFLGRYPEALDFADRSERLFTQVPLPEYDLARLALVRAYILRSIDRVPEATALARGAAETFRRYGDRARAVSAQMIEAAMVFQGGAISEALALWEPLQNDPAVDGVGRVRLLHNLAACYRQLGRPDTAVEYLQRSVTEFDMLGMATERTRSRWNLGQTLVLAGRAKDGIPVLRQAWREFEALEMYSDGALAALELAEALLVIGQPAEVPSICRDIVARFTAAGMTSRAITALSFLREAVAIGQATPSLVRHVYDFLRELPAERPRLFASPPSDGVD